MRRLAFVLLAILSLVAAPHAQRSLLTVPSAGTWPTLTAFNTNNFVDHFTGASLNARWTAVTSGTGAVTVTDSYAQLAAPANSAAFIYYNTQIDKTKSQLWMICFDQSTLDNSGFAARFGALVNGAGAPAADTKANIDAKTIMDRLWGGNGIRLQYYDSGGAGHVWSSASNTYVAAGSTGATDVDTNARADDYYVVGYEIDGPGSRWRELVWGATYTGGYTFNQGARLFAVSDWVTWANTRTNTNVWLVIGSMMTNNTVANTVRVEWVRYAEAPAATNVPIDAWFDISSTTGSAGAKAQTQHHWSYDGYVFVPEDRTTLALALGGTTYDDNDISPTSAAYDGLTTDWIAYQSAGSVTTSSINFASATHAAPQNGPWTKCGSNPKIGLGANETIIAFPFLFKDTVSGLWTLLFSVKSTIDSKWRLHMATMPVSSTPCAGTWTRLGVILDVGGAGAFDETAARDGIPIYSNGQWEVWYEGWDATAGQAIAKIGRATGPSLTALTKDGAGARISYIANADSAITANLTGRTATLTSTTGMSADGPIVFVHNNNGHTYSYSRIRKVTDATHVELYTGLDGFTTTLPDRGAQNDSVRYWSPRGMAFVGNSQWWFYVNIWGTFNVYDGANYAAYRHQVGGLMTLTNISTIGGTPVLDLLSFPGASPGNFNNDTETVENMTLLNLPR